MINIYVSRQFTAGEILLIQELQEIRTSHAKRFIDKHKLDRPMRRQLSFSVKRHGESEGSDLVPRRNIAKRSFTVALSPWQQS